MFNRFSVIFWNPPYLLDTGCLNSSQDEPFMIVGQLQRKIGLKVLELGGNSVIG